MADKLEVVPGPGLVARFGEVEVWAGPQATPLLQSHLVSEAQRAGQSTSGGDQLASSFIAILQRGDPEPQAPFAVVGRGQRAYPVPARTGPGLGQRPLAGSSTRARLDGHVHRPAVAVDRAALRVPPTASEPTGQPFRPGHRHRSRGGVRPVTPTLGASRRRSGPSRRSAPANPANPAPANPARPANPAQTGQPGQPGQPGQTRPRRADDRSPVGGAQPVAACPGRTCPGRTCPGRTCPGRTCPGRTCPRRTGPGRPGPSGPVPGGPGFGSPLCRPPPGGPGAGGAPGALASFAQSSPVASPAAPLPRTQGRAGGGPVDLRLATLASKPPLRLAPTPPSAIGDRPEVPGVRCEKGHFNHPKAAELPALRAAHAGWCPARPTGPGPPSAPSWPTMVQSGAWPVVA